MANHPKIVMRHSVLLPAILCLATWTAVPIPRALAQGVSSAAVGAPEQQVASRDSVIQFLLAAAATDFLTHRSPSPVRFRKVRLAHTRKASGEVQYMLCGQFLPAHDDRTAEWTPFATIKTSGYEQYLGSQATSLCHSSEVEWDRVEDLSALLQSRVDSLR
jgi:hypothetical protein